MGRRRNTHRPPAGRDLPDGSRGDSAARRDDSPPWAALLAAGLIVLATAAAFSNSFGGPFIFDDNGAISENLSIRRLWPVWTPLSPPKHGEPVTGRPILNFSLAVNYATSGPNVWSYHATNLAIHVAAALLLFGLLRRTFLLPAMRDGWGAASIPMALAIALLWAVHPLQTESVTYVVQRAESLVGLFYLLTLYGLVRGASAARPLGWYALSALACLLGMASKEVMVSAPLIVLLYDRTFLAGSFRGAWRQRSGLYLALAGTWLVLGWLVISSGNRGGSAGFGLGLDWRDYLGTQFGAIVHYLKLCVWPDPLLLDYGTATAHNAAEIVPYAIVVGLLGLATVTALWRWPKAGFLGGCFFALLAPTSSIVPVVTQTVAEHRMYLPLAAVLTLVLSGGYAVHRNLVCREWLPRLWADILGGCVVAVAALTLGMSTFQRNADYRSELSIWQDTVRKAPDNVRAHCNLGIALALGGRLDEAMEQYQKALEIQPDSAEAHNNLGHALAACGRTDEAMEHYRKALAIQPDSAEAHDNFGIALAAGGRLDDAMAHYRKALDIRPDDAEAHNNLGIALAAGGRLDEAVAHYQKALEIRPDFANAHYNLGIALALGGRLDEAMAHFRKALEIQPDLVEAHNNLGYVLALAGRPDEAMTHYRKALEIRPDFADAMNHLARLLAVCPEASLRNGAEAVELAQRVDELTGGRQAEVLDTLAAAYAEAGRFQEALATARKALELATQQNKQALADALRTRIILYEAGKPFHQTPSGSASPPPNR